MRYFNKAMLVASAALCLNLSVFSQNITLKTGNVTVKEAMEQLKKSSGYSFVFSSVDVDTQKHISISVQDGNIDDVVRQILAGQIGITYEIKDKNIIIKKSENGVVSSKKLQTKGSVRDVNGEPIIGATVMERGTSNGTITDIDGNFMLEVPEGAMLDISYVGYKNQSVQVLSGKQIAISLREDSETLDEVVVIGYGAQKKVNVIGSIATLDSETLESRAVPDVSNMLTGQLSGVTITQTSGNPGQDAGTIRVRGVGSFGATPDPLVLIDGMPGSLSDLTPSEIENISVLKDAASAAIYGSRAANGVIVIESKTPKPGRIWVTYGGELRIEAPDMTGYNLMNAREKIDAELQSGLYTYGGETVEKWQLYQSKLREVLAGVNTYWLDKPLQTAFQQRHTVTLEGGDEALRYRMYVGYNNSPGVMKDSKRDVLTGSLDFQYRLKKVLLKNSITLDNSVANESPWGSFSEYTRLNPYLRPYGEDGEIQKRLDNFEGIGGDSNYLNPMYNTTFNSKDQSKNFAVRELFKVEYNPTEELRLEGAFSLSKSVGHRDIFRPAQHTAFDDVTDPTLRGDYRRSQSESVSWGVDLTGSWNKQLRDHYLTANARMSVLENTSETFGNYVTGFPNDNMDNLLFGKKYNEKVTGLESTSRSIGWVAAGGYSYKYKYSFDFNIRLDGSSQFGKDNRWAPFWSTGLRWDLKKENFLKNVSFISDLILRGTYGTTGSQGFDPYQAHGYYTYANLLLPYYSSDATGSEILAMHNESLKWQTTKSTNLALELGLFDQRFTARIEYYRKITDNMITQVSLAPSVGFPQYPENIGKIENKGWEISLSAIPYKNTAKQAYWTIMVNGSHNADKLLKISEAMKHMNDQNSLKLKDMPLPRYEEGESLSRIWVVRSLGIDPASGDEILLKRNGEMTSAVNWNANDVVPIGNTEPKWQGYINSSFTYMGWGADVSFRYQFGGQVYNQTLLDKVENANLKYNADRRVSQLRWMNPGDKAQFRAINSTGWETKATSRFIMDENVFQGSSLSVYYRMDRTNTKFIGHWGLSSAKVSFNMEDFFYLSTVKRERGLYYPYSRQFTFSLNVGF